jgi:hypothetical protein
MERRVLLKLIAAGIVAPQFDSSPSGLVSLSAAEKPYELQFFSKKQSELLDRLCEIIIPADDHSPGAQAAKVNLYIDIMISDRGEAEKKQWLAGLDAVEREAQRRFQKTFLQCDAQQQDAIAATMARNEQNPTTDLERFFGTLKRMTIDGYYTSKVGIHQELQYQGNTALSEFPGCTHPEHQA